MHQQPLRPDEHEYRTQVDTESTSAEPAGSASPAAEPRPWIIVGLVLLVVFAGILLYWLILPLF
jgi:hypothetical protein